MKTMNRVFLLGRLGAQPKLVMSKNGKPYTRLSVATHRVWMNTADSREERTDWHSVFVFGPLAETCCQTLDKGSAVLVEGSLSYWKMGEKDYKNAIHGQEVTFLSAAPRADHPTLDEEYSTGDAPAAPLPASDLETVDNPSRSRNHNAVAHPA